MFWFKSRKARFSENQRSEVDASIQYGKNKSFSWCILLLSFFELKNWIDLWKKFDSN